MQRSDLEGLLPSVFQDAIGDGNPLDALLEVMHHLPQPIEERLSSVESLFDPRRTPEAMIGFLAGWVDLDRFLVRRAEDGSGGELISGSGCLRELCAEAAGLSRLRGTPRGMIRFLEIATGYSGYHIEENIDRNGHARSFHLLLTAPRGTEAYSALIHAIVVSEKPAYVTYDPAELRFS